LQTKCAEPKLPSRASPRTLAFSISSLAFLIEPCFLGTKMDNGMQSRSSTMKLVFFHIYDANRMLKVVSIVTLCATRKATIVCVKATFCYSVMSLIVVLSWLVEANVETWRARGDLNPGLSRAFSAHSTADSAVRLGGSASLQRLSAALSILRPVGINPRDCATGPAENTSPPCQHIVYSEEAVHEQFYGANRIAGQTRCARTGTF